MTTTKPQKSLLDLVNEVNNVPENYDYTQLYKLLLPDDPRPHGYMLPTTVTKMPWTPEFQINHTTRTIQLHDTSNGTATSTACTTSFQTVINHAIDHQLFPNAATHSEPYKILGTHHSITIERFFAPYFGIATRGAHMTAYTFTPSGEKKIWIARRSPHIFTYPNKLDSTVAGGVKASHSPRDCIIAEAGEEASLPEAYVREHAKAVGVVSYMTSSPASGLLYPCLLYLYDIEVPGDMIPVPQDEEVAEFRLMSVEEVMDAVLGEEFKRNCVLVMVDFFVRHGLLGLEDERDYVELLWKCRGRLSVPVMPERS